MIRLFLTYFLISSRLIVGASDTLTLIQFENIVKKNHPLIKSADLYDEITTSYLLKGQGALDPKFYTDYDGKQFKDQNYFRRWNSELKIPTKYPIEVSLGYENNSGDFLNNENNLPSNGLLYGTISVSVLRGLLFDEQRFALKESMLLADKSKIEKELVVRKVVIQSRSAYVDWSTAFSELKIITSYLDRVTERHDFVIQLFENGDKPAMDTIESRINLNTATKAKIIATENLLIKRQKLNMFLWDNFDEPLALLESVIPQDIAVVTNILFAETIPMSQDWNSDPIIRKKQIELEQINLENRLEREKLKPQMDIKLNTIHSLGEGDLSYSYSVNDYKFGATVSVPIRNRKTRGQIQLNQVSINQNKLDQLYYQAELQNMYNTLSSTQVLKLEALDISLENVENSNLLYTAEQLKFGLGESSVFLLNSREKKLLEAEIEYIKILKALALIYNELYFLKIGQENN